VTKREVVTLVNGNFLSRLIGTCFGGANAFSGLDHSSPDDDDDSLRWCARSRIATSWWAVNQRTDPGDACWSSLQESPHEHQQSQLLSRIITNVVRVPLP